jgi:hypothetical protein
MPIYSHEVSSGLRRTVTALPVFGSAATNTVVLGSAIVLVVVAITLLFGPSPDDGRGAAARRAVRCIVYALPVVLVLLYVYGGSIAATVEGGAAPQLAALMTGPAHEVRPRIDYATGMPMPAPDMPPPVAPLAPMPAVNSAETTVSARLAQIENSLQRS